MVRRQQVENKDEVREDIQLYLSNEYERPLKKRGKITIDLADGERARLEQRYARLLVERFDYKRLVTYVPNKAIPVYNWFKFKEGFSRQLVVSLLDSFGLTTGSVVYDPFVGCGTTLLACKELGIGAVGTDVLPVALFVARAKVTDWPEPQVLRRAVRKLSEAQPHEPLGSLPRIRIIDLAFSPTVQKEIVFFKEQIDHFELPVRNFLLLGLLGVLERASSTSKDGQFLRLVNRPPCSLRAALLSELNSMIEDLQFISAERGNASGKVDVIAGDARELCLPSEYHGAVDAVITSPPYLNRYDYSRSYALELCLLSVKCHADMVAVRHGLLRSHIESRQHSGKALQLPAVDEILRELAKKELNNERVPTMVRGYFEDMNQVIGNLFRYLKVGGRVALVVANAQFAGESVPTDLMLCELAAHHGFVTEEIWVTRYKGNSSQQMAIYGRRPVRESIVFWRKNA